MNKSEFNTGLLSFLNASPTPYHAVASAQALLTKAGFVRLDEKDGWNLEAGGRYYYSRRDSSLVAFIMGEENAAEKGLRLLGAHTDSPCLKVKTNPEKVQHSYAQLGIEVYGGALLNPWFDRDLSLAGRVNYREGSGKLQSALVNFQRPLAVIPSLAIHLDREANSNRSINPQEDMRAILLQPDDARFDFRHLLRQELAAQGLAAADSQVIDFDMSFYDTQAAALVGVDAAFVAGARLDNLLSCYVGLRALATAPVAHTSVLVLNDHEEVGSVSDTGAQGTLLTNLLERLLPETESRQRAISRSLMYSIDNAHGIHPNYPRKHDESHGPILNKGPVLKINANQRYATTSDGAAFTRLLAEQEGLPLQAFVSRADMACGSTIGPMTAAKLGVATVDIGVPTFAMHSVRELGGAEDAWVLCELMSQFVRQDQLL